MRQSVIEVEGKPIFQLTLMRWIGRDDKSDGYNTLTLLDTDPPDKKLQSVNLLLRSYLFEFMIIGENDPGDVDRGTAWVVDYSPREEPVLKTREHGIDAELNNLMLDVTDPLIIPK